MNTCHFTLAPRHLSRGEVLEGARATLGLEHVYVVLRPAGVGRWRFGLGVSHPSNRSYDTKLDAERAGVSAWRWAYNKRLKVLRAARGGDLSWGKPILVLERPQVVEAGEREGVRFAQAREPHPDALEGPVALATHAAERRALREAREEGTVSKTQALAGLLARDRELGGVLPDRMELTRLLLAAKALRTRGA